MRRLAAGLLLSLLLTPSFVTAQAPPPDPSALDQAQRDELGRLFSRAQAAYEAGNFLEAIEALRAAYAIFPEPNILYRIGDAYENLGDLGRAAEFYRRYVTDAPNSRDAGLVRRRVDDLERRATDLETRLDNSAPVRSALLLDTNPAGSRVRLDDRAVDGATPVRVEVEPGTHRIELQRDGYLPVVREIRVDAGETISLVYQLEREAAPPPPEPRSAWPWVLGGAGIGALGTSVGFLIGSRAAGGQVETWDTERAAAYSAGQTPPARPDGYDGAVKREVVFRNVAYIAGGVGVVALTTGILWLALRGGDRHTSSQLQVTADGIAFRF